MINNMSFYEKSSCCGASLTVSTADEGTSCYICNSCNNLCDASSGGRMVISGVKINDIINEALMGKVFSLEIIERIESFRDGFEAAQRRIKDLEKLSSEFSKENEVLRIEKSDLMEKVKDFEQREV